MANEASQTHVYELGIQMPEPLGTATCQRTRTMIEAVARMLPSPPVKQYLPPGCSDCACRPTG